jgi:hypothetical protein
MQEKVPVSEQKHAGASVEDLVAVGDGDLLRHLILQVLDHKGVGLVQYSESKTIILFPKTCLLSKFHTIQTLHFWGAGFYNFFSFRRKQP